MWDMSMQGPCRTGVRSARPGRVPTTVVAVLVAVLVAACGGGTVDEDDAGDAVDDGAAVAEPAEQEPATEPADDAEADPEGEDGSDEEPDPPAPTVVEAGSVVVGTLVDGPRNLDVEAFAPDTCLYLEVESMRYALRPTVPADGVGVSFSLEPPGDLETGQPVLMQMDDTGEELVEVGVLARAGDEVAIAVEGVDPYEASHPLYIGCDDAETLIYFSELADQ